MKTWKIVYWHGGNKKIIKIDAVDKSQARRLFYMRVAHDDIISIEEVKDDV